MWCDSLESRRLLAIDLVGSQVVITGTGGNNLVYIIRAKSLPNKRITVVLDNSEATFLESQITSFKVNAKGGNDTITTDSSRGVITLTRFITCGEGNDT